MPKPFSNDYILNTSNPRKYAEYQALGFHYPRTTVDLPEPDADPVTVIKHKVAALGPKVIVDDGSFDVEGADIGVNVRWLKERVGDYVGRKAVLRVLLGVMEEDGRVYIYKGEVHGEVVSPTGAGRFSLDALFRPLGSAYTLAESKPNRYNARALAVANFRRGRPWKVTRPLSDYKGPMQQKRTAGRLRRGVEHDTQEALKQYLEEHPAADPKNHSVKKPSGGGLGAPLAKGTLHKALDRLRAKKTDFMVKFRQEMQETKALGGTIKKLVSGETISDQERAEAKTQTLDVFKMLFIGGTKAVPIPGISLVYPVVVAAINRLFKKNYNWAPSSFAKKKAAAGDPLKIFLDAVLDDVFALKGHSSSDRVARLYVQAKTFELNEGDPVLFGKFLNKPGKITGFGQTEKGDPTVKVEPAKGGQEKEVKLFKIREGEREKQAGMPMNAPEITTQWGAKSLRVVLTGEKAPTPWEPGSLETEVGYVSLSLTAPQRCMDAWVEAQASNPTLRGVMVATQAFIYEPAYKGKGWGSALYERAIVEAGKRGFAVTPMHCWHPGGTSSDAQRVWAALKTRYPHVGDILWAPFLGRTAKEQSLPSGWQSDVKPNGWVVYTNPTRTIRVQDTRRPHPERYQLVALEMPQVLVEGEVRDMGHTPVWNEYQGYSKLSEALKAAVALGQRKARKVAKYKEKKTVKGEDGEDTTVYVYSERQVTKRHKDKAERLDKLRSKMADLEKKVKADLTAKDETKRLTALAVGLMSETFERVGNPQSAEDGHYGVTGWLVKHVTFSGSTATVKYVGKSGVAHTKKVEDAALVKALKAAAEGKGKEDSLTGTVGSEQVNEYLKPFDITAKDIRGLRANQETQTRLKAIRSKGGTLPKDKKERETKLKKEFKQALEEAADAVGHEASTLRSQYLVPGMEEEYVSKGTVTEKLNKTAARPIKIDKAAIRELAKGVVRELPKHLKFRDMDEPLQDTRGYTPTWGFHLADYYSTSVGGTPVRIPIHVGAKNGKLEPGMARQWVAGGRVTTRFVGVSRKGYPIMLVVNIDSTKTPEALLANLGKVEDEVYSVLIHEMTHALDLLSRSDSNTDDLSGNPVAYYNALPEVRAFMQQIADEVVTYVEKIGRDTGADMGMWALEQALDYSPTWHRVRKHLTPKSKKTLLKGIYTHLSDHYRANPKKFTEEGSL